MHARPLASWVMISTLIGWTAPGCFQGDSTGDEIGDTEESTDTEGTESTSTTETETTETTETDSSSSETDECAADMSGPSLVAPLEPIVGPHGETSVMLTLSFDEPVELGEGALAISGDAMLVAPSLPASGMDFDVLLSGVASDQAYTLSVVAAAVTDACGNPMAADAEITVNGVCVVDEAAPQIISASFLQLDAGTTMAEYVLEFDEPVALPQAGISIGGGAMITAVEPALPAISDSFTISVSNLSGIHQLGVSGVFDTCGNALVDSAIAICSIDEVVFNSSLFLIPWVVPACAEGQVTIEAFGAQGQAAQNGGTGGLGGYATGDLAVETGETLHIAVGSQTSGGGPGSGPNGAGRGGGAADVRQGGNMLANRVIVAGGGGGGGGDASGSCADEGVGGNGGSAGGASGATGTVGTGCGGSQSTGGAGGTQQAGGAGGIGHTNCSAQGGPGEVGSLGAGGKGGNGVIGCAGFTGAGGGGGGNGYYGGGGGAGGPGGGGGSWGGGGGGGGSSYVGGVDGGTTMPGVNLGNGQVIISW